MSAKHGRKHGSTVLRALLAAGIALVSVVGAPAVARASLRTPRPVWTHVMRDGPWGMAVDRRGVVVTTDWKVVQSLDRGGHVRWTVRVDNIVKGAPAIDGGLVLVGGRGRVTALGRANGEERWRRPMGADVTSVAIAGGLALVGDQAGTLTAFDARTGAPRWSVHFDGRLWSAARVDANTGTVVATWHWSATSAMRVFDLATGALRWDAPTDGFTSAPVVENGLAMVAIGDGNDHARVEAHDLATGALRWSTPVPGSFEEAIEPAADAQDVAVVDHDGVVTLLDSATGTVRWQHDTEYLTIESRMALTANRVVFTAFSGDLFVLDRKSGRVLSKQNWHRLHGYPIGYAAASWLPRNSLVVALRDLAPFRVELLPIA